MEDAALLAELLTLAEHMPDFSKFTPTSRIYHEWLGKLQALVRLWNPAEIPPLRGELDYLGFTVVREKALSNIIAVLFRAIGDLQLRVQGAPAKAFGPGAVYDFFKALRDLLTSATKSIFIVDPYLDVQIFDTYLDAVGQQVTVRLLTHKSAAALKSAVVRFVTQSKIPVEVRSSTGIHDRVLFLDDRSCWVLGQSIKDAATSKPTYLAPLEQETAQMKKASYEQIWKTSVPI